MSIDDSTVKAKVKPIDFSGVLLPNSTDCSLKCEFEINDIDNVNIIKHSTKKGHFKINSSLFTIKYGTKVHNFRESNHFLSSSIIHEGLYPLNQNYGILTELVLKARDLNNKELMIFIPVYNGKRNNKNGEILNKMLNNSSGTYNIAGFFPYDIGYYNLYYEINGSQKRVVIFTSSKITLTQSTFNNIKTTTIPDEIINEYRNIDIILENITKNSKGIVTGVTETTIIDCQPVDDNGMLLIDKEKGLGQTGITNTSSVKAMEEKYLSGETGQFIIGILLFLMITTLMRNTYNMIK